MSILENSWKKKEAANQTAQKEKDKNKLTTADILSDTENNKLFGDFLQKNRKVLLAKRLRENKLSAKDLRDLEGLRSEFSSKMEKAKEIGDFLTVETVRSMASRNPEFSLLLDQVGEARMLNVWKNKLKELSMKDETRFERVYKSISGYKENIKESEDEIKRLCKLNNIEETAFEKILGMPGETPAERQARAKAIESELNKKCGYFKRFFYTQVAAKDIEVETENLLSMSFAEIDQNIKDLGEVLQSTLNENKDMREALNREITGDKKPGRRDSAFQETTKHVMTEDQILQEWQTSRPANFETMDLAAQESTRDDFLQKIQAKKENDMGEVKKKGGFWSKIIEGVFSAFFIGFNKNKLK